MSRASSIDRRNLLEGSFAFAATCLARPAIAVGATPEILVLGAGAGGATAARALKQFLGEDANITVITGDSPLYHAPFLGTSLLLGQAVPPPVSVAEVLGRDGLGVVQGEAIALHPAAKTLDVSTGGKRRTLRYDLLVASPGVSLGRYGNSDADENSKMALCWTAGTGCISQRDQITSLKPGATLVFVAPPQPYRCPPSLYERVCLTAHLLKPANPGAKILIVDEKDEYPMQALFETAYTDYYDRMIEWVPRDFHGGVTGIDPASRLVKTQTETFTGDFLQALPPQTAPSLLKEAGLVNDRGYCPVIAPSMRSQHDDSIYVVGDAADMIEMSKSAVSAAVQGKLAARDIARRLANRSPSPDITIADQCWTFLAPDDAISLGGTYRAENSNFVAVTRHVSLPDEGAAHRKKNAEMARAWPAEMLDQVFNSRK